MPAFVFANYSLEFILLATSLLLVLSVLASKASGISGIPVLLLFLFIGMLAGSEGPGGIEFSNYPIAFAIGSVTLALIIFDGGLRTSWESVRPIIGVGISLSFIGVVATAILTGTFVHLALGTSLLDGLLLGAIVSSTDAAAVFSILRSRSLSLKGTLKQVLEFESGSNDPIAVFLTIGVLAFMASPDRGIADGATFLIMQIGLGLVLGWWGGKGIRWLINNVGLEYEGLYSVLLLALVILVFSGTNALGGSGFLAVYIIGLMLGNSELLHKGSLLRFSDGIGWISQILLFLTLGLLVSPSNLLGSWKQGLMLAAFMMLVARPVSVLVAAPKSPFNRRERIFISWVGLRGAAPILLATLPWNAQHPNAESIFNLVFFVVLISVLFQGTSIPWLARRLKLAEPLREEPRMDVAIGMLPAGFISVEMEVQPGSQAVDKRVIDLTLPSGVLLTSVEREGRFIIPKGDTTFAVKDHIWCLARPSNVVGLKEIFGRAWISEEA